MAVKSNAVKIFGRLTFSLSLDARSSEIFCLRNNFPPIDCITFIGIKDSILFPTLSIPPRTVPIHPTFVLVVGESFTHPNTTIRKELTKLTNWKIYIGWFTHQFNNP